MPDGSDPAQLLADHGPAALTAALSRPRPLGEMLLDERLEHRPADRARLEAAKILAAQPSHAWEPGLDQVGDWLQVSQTQARRDLAAAVAAWDADPRRAATAGANVSHAVKVRLEQENAAVLKPAERWAPVAESADARLLEQRDWPLLAGIMQEISAAGRDVASTVRQLIAEKPLNDEPALDLRYRLVSRVDVTIETGEARTVGARHPVAAPPRERTTTQVQPPNGPRR